MTRVIYNQGAMAMKSHVVASAGRVVAFFATYQDQAKQSPRYLFLLVSLLSLWLPSCSAQLTSTPLPQIKQESVPIKSSIQIVTSTPVGTFIGDAVPSALRKQVEGLIVRLDISTSPAQGSQNETQIQWVYTLVAPFPTVTDGVTFDELKLAWTQGTAPTPFTGHPLLMEESTLAAFTALWGEPAASSVKVIAADQLLDNAWSDSPSWALIPFESLAPKWKVLTIDGQSPIRKKFDLSSYPLVVPFTLKVSDNSQLSGILTSNYDSSNPPGAPCRPTPPSPGCRPRRRCRPRSSG